MLGRLAYGHPAEQETTPKKQLSHVLKFVHAVFDSVFFIFKLIDILLL